MQITTVVEGIYIPKTSTMREYPDTCSMRISNFVTVEASTIEKALEIAREPLLRRIPSKEYGDYFLAMMKVGNFSAKDIDQKLEFMQEYEGVFIYREENDVDPRVNRSRDRNEGRRIS